MTLFALLSVAFTSTAALVVPSDDAQWPDYRGPMGNGHVDAELPVRWSESEGLLYKSAMPGRGWSTPVVVDGQIWMTTSLSEGHDFGIVCADLETGDVVDIRELFTSEKPEPINKLNSYASPSPVAEAGRLYAHFGTYGTAAINTDNGSVMWTRDDIHCDHMQGPGSSPVLWNNLLVFHMDGGDTQYVIALDTGTGETVWTTERSQPLTDIPADLRKAYSTPFVAKVGDQVQLISTGAQYTFGYDVRTGDELWHASVKGFSMSARPSFAHGHAYLNTGFGKARLVALKLGEMGTLPAEATSWEYTKNVPTMSSHLVVGDEVFMVDDGGIATCLDAHSGERIWRERISGQYSSSPIYNRGHVYFFSREGHGTVVKASREFEVVASNELEDGFMASPVVVGNTLILRAKEHLYRIGSTDASASDQ